MSGALFYKSPDGTIYIGFSHRGEIGLDNNKYLLWGKRLTKELKEKINSRLQEIWKTDQDLLISLVRGKKSKQIYDLFGIKDMDNGWFMDQWSEQQKQREQESKEHTNLLKFEYHIEKQEEQKIEDRKWKLYNLKWQVDPSVGTTRVKRLRHQVRKKLRRSYSSSEIGNEEKLDEYPFFLEKWGLGQPVQVETPEFLKLKEVRKIPRIDKKKRNVF